LYSAPGGSCKPSFGGRVSETGGSKVGAPGQELRRGLWRGRHGRLVLAAPEAATGGLQTAFGWHVLGGLSQAEDGHVVVDRLVAARLNHVGLVPDADATIGPNGLVEAAPGGEVRIVRVPGETFQIFVRSPVLDQRRPPSPRGHRDRRCPFRGHSGADRPDRAGARGAQAAFCRGSGHIPVRNITRRTSPRSGPGRWSRATLRARRTPPTKRPSIAATGRGLLVGAPTFGLPDGADRGQALFTELPRGRVFSESGLPENPVDP
jgi:hypothetical protein